MVCRPCRCELVAANVTGTTVTDFTTVQVTVRVATPAGAYFVRMRAIKYGEVGIYCAVESFGLKTAMKTVLARRWLPTLNRGHATPG